MAASSSNIERSESMIYQFKISLKGYKPSIWRRIEVPQEYTFLYLHIAIQRAMGWCDAHLHSFQIKNPKTGKKATIGKPYDKEVDYLRHNTICERSAKISDFFVAPKDKGTYMYDFGDGWDHNVVLEAIFPAVPENRYPKCTAGKMACPPEDCGGVSGYENLLKIIGDPSHPEYEDMKEWVEGMVSEDFDPTKFDPESVLFLYF